MNVLILSCNTGGGHNAAARAVAEVFRAHGDEAVVLDYLKLAGEKVSRTVGNVYVETVKIAPGLFGLLYKIGMLVSRLLRRSPVYYVNGKMAVYLAAYLKKHPADVIVMPHLYPAETITYMKRKGMKLPLTVAVMTDYTCIPFWEETDCDYYMIPHESLIPEIVKRGIPEEKLVVTGIPVAAACSEPWSGMPEESAAADTHTHSIVRKNAQQAAKKSLGLEEKQRYILVAGGSMGAGSIDRLIPALLRRMQREEHLILICGSNQKLEQRMRARFGRDARVTILGSVSNMPVYLHACDIIYTKPGGLTSTEAAVTEISIVHTKPIPGCETKNRSFFAKKGMSVTAYTEYGLVRRGMQLLHNPGKRNAMQRAQHRGMEKHSAEKIYQFVKAKI